MIFLHIYAYFLHNLEQGIGFTQQKKAKGKLVEYKYENKSLFQA